MTGRKQFAIAVALLLVGGGGREGWKCATGWVANAEDSHDSEAVQAEEQSELKLVVESNTAILEQLTQIQLAGDAARAATRLLCQKGEVTSCETCQDVEVFDTPQCKAKAKR